MAEDSDQRADAPPDLVTQALIFIKHGDFASARSVMREYAASNPREAQHYQIEGLAALALADWPAAQELFAAACREHPQQPSFWFNLGLAEENLGAAAKAESAYRRSLELKPGQAEAYGNLSNLCRRQGRYGEAELFARQALEAGLPRPDAQNLLGLALGRQGQFDAARAALDEAAASGDAAMLANRANLAVDALDFEQAWKFFAAARKADDTAIMRRDEGMARLLAGDYAKGWPLYEARLELPNALRVTPACPRWQGEKLNGKKLLLVSEQGYGDAIQFGRYAAKLIAMGLDTHDLFWTVRQPLQKLLADNLPGHILTEGNPLPPTDYWLPILSLPMRLDINTPTPAPIRLRAPQSPRLPDAPGQRKIGMVWSGSPTHERDHERSIPLEMLKPLWTSSNAHFYAPFKGAAAALIESGTPVEPLDEQINDFADAAALIAQLDCLITVDTASAHLSGALGVKTFLLLPYCPDWRWGISGEATGWYPSLTLLRQPRYGDWTGVIEKLVGII